MQESGEETKEVYGRIESRKAQSRHLEKTSRYMQSTFEKFEEQKFAKVNSRILKSVGPTTERTRCREMCFVFSAETVGESLNR